MGISNLVAASAGLSSTIKSIQRGTAGGAGNISISSVNTSKTTVNSFSTSSAGYVAATGSVGAQNGSVGAGWAQWSTSTYPYTLTIQNSNEVYGYTVVGRYTSYTAYSQYPTATWNYNANASNISGGSTDLTTKQYGAYLVDATTIYATGPCQYEVIEYN